MNSAKLHADDETTYAVTPEAQCQIREDAAMDAQSQAVLHFELIQRMFVSNRYGAADDKHVAPEILRARALIERGVPAGPPRPAPASIRHEGEDIMLPVTIHDARRPRCFDALIKWAWPQEVEAELSALLLEYGRRGYFEVDFINAAGSPEKETLLECAVMAENHCAAAVFIELGADLSLVPSKYKTINGMGVCEGDFHGLISKRFRRGSPMDTAVSGALMRLEIKAAAAGASEVIPLTDEISAPGDDVNSPDSATSGPARRRGL